MQNLTIEQLSILTNLICKLLLTYKQDPNYDDTMGPDCYNGDYYNLIIDTIENKMDNEPDTITNDERLFLLFTKQ